MLPVARIEPYRGRQWGKTPRSRGNITTFGKREKYRMASNPSSEFDVGRGSSPGRVLHPFLLALHTNLAADVTQLEPVQTVIQISDVT